MRAFSGEATGRGVPPVRWTMAVRAMGCGPGPVRPLVPDRTCCPLGNDGSRIGEGPLIGQLLIGRRATVDSRFGDGAQQRDEVGSRRAVMKARAYGDPQVFADGKVASRPVDDESQVRPRLHDIRVGPTHRCPVYAPGRWRVLSRTAPRMPDGPSTMKRRADDSVTSGADAGLVLGAISIRTANRPSWGWVPRAR